MVWRLVGDAQAGSRREGARPGARGASNRLVCQSTLSAGFLYSVFTSCQLTGWHLTYAGLLLHVYLWTGCALGESLKADLVGELGRIAAFLGIPCNDAMADLVAQGSTFKVVCKCRPNQCCELN